MVKDTTLTELSTIMEFRTGEAGNAFYKISSWPETGKVESVEAMLQSGQGLSTYVGYGIGLDGSLALCFKDKDSGAPATYTDTYLVSIKALGKTFNSVVTVNCKAFARGELPKIYIKTNDGSTPRDKENWVPGTIRISGGTNFNDLIETPMHIRLRGNLTITYEKKPYAIKMASRTGLLGMPSHKRWCLLANYGDPTLLRNRMAFYISRSTGIRYTTRSESADLYFNDEFMGNYLLTEQIKVDAHRLDIPENGSYLLELDGYGHKTSDPEYDPDNKFAFESSQSMPVNIKFPEDTNKIAEIKQYFNDTENALIENTTSSIERYVDVDSFLNFWLVYEVMNNMEVNSPKSFYCYKPVGDRLYAGPVWDFDYFVLASGNSMNPVHLWAMAKWGNTFRPMHYLLKNPDINKRARSKIMQMYPFLGTIRSWIDKEAAYIHDAAKQDEAKWGIHLNNNHILFKKMNFEDAVSEMKDVFDGRLQMLEESAAKQPIDTNH